MLGKGCGERSCLLSAMGSKPGPRYSQGISYEISTPGISVLNMEEKSSLGESRCQTVHPKERSCWCFSHFVFMRSCPVKRPHPLVRNAAGLRSRRCGTVKQIVSEWALPISPAFMRAIHGGT